MWSNSLGCKYALIMSCESPLKDQILHQVRLDESIRERFKNLLSQPDSGQTRKMIIQNLIQQAEEHIRFHESTVVDLCPGLNSECRECLQDHVEDWVKIGNGCSGENEWKVIGYRPRNIPHS